MPRAGQATAGGLPGTEFNIQTRPRRRERPRLVLALRIAIVLAAVAVAYHHSLLTLIRNVALDTPLAYLGLVPVIALGLALFLGTRRYWEPDVHDRYVDYIVGLPLLLIALAVVLAGPVLLSSFYWRWRLDLLTLPLFVAGAITLVFGLRTMWRLKLPIAFLFLAWPLPWTHLLGDWLRVLTDATTAGVRQLVAVIPVASPVAGGDGSLFQIQNGSAPFVVSVGSACAGINGSVGFLLVGTALVGLLRGNLVAKAAWLLAGMALTWALNVVRIMLIFAAGGAWGEDFAIDALHPFIGLITFNVGLLAMFLALPLFRLRLESRPRLPSRDVTRTARVPASPGRDPLNPAPDPARAALGPAVVRQPVHRLAVQRGAVALAIVVASAILGGAANAGLREHELVGQDLGQPRLTGFSAATATVAGWTASLTNSYPWARQYFGKTSNWNRYTYLFSPAEGLPGGTPPAYVTVDVISTADLGTFAAYGLEACYGFHNYSLMETRRADLGAGVAGKSIVYYNPSTTTSWTAVYWEWPIQDGGGEEYERVILNATAVGGPAPTELPARDLLAELQFALASAFGAPPGELTDPQFIATRDFLLGFARDLVRSRTQPAVATNTK